MRRGSNRGANTLTWRKFGRGMSQTDPAELPVGALASAINVDAEDQRR